MFRGSWRSDGNVRLAFGSSLVRADLVPSDFKLPAAHAQRGLLSRLFGAYSDSLAGLKTLGAVTEMDYVSRSSEMPV